MNPEFSNVPEPSDTYSTEEAAAVQASCGAPVPIPVSTSVFSDVRHAFSKVGSAYLVLMASLLTISYVVQYAIYFTAP
jgi:hypothetical protein